MIKYFFNLYGLSANFYLKAIICGNFKYLDDLDPIFKHYMFIKIKF